MKNTVTPIKDAASRVIDFVVERECEGCKKRRAKLAKFVRKVDKSARDLLRRRKRK